MDQVASARPSADDSRNLSPAERARSIYDILSAEAADGEARGQLTDTAVAAIRSQNLFGMLLPKCFGGQEIGAVEAIEVLEILCEADGSSGWSVMACEVSTGVSATFLPDEAAQQIFGNGPAIVVGQGAPRGRADFDGKGYRLSGTWSYASGIMHADYVHAGARVYVNGEPRDMRLFVVPISQVKILGNWDVIGLRATASVDYAIEDVYVPQAFSFSPHILAPLRGGNFYKLGLVGIGPLAHGAFAIGVSRRILNELASLATSSGGKPSALMDGAQSESFQEGFAAAEAKLRAGRAFLFEAYRDAEATIEKGDVVSQRLTTLMRLSVIHVTQLAAEICNFAYHVSGGVGLRNGVIQRCYRDMLAAYQHVSVSNSLIRHCAREVLGLADGKIWTFAGLMDPMQESSSARAIQENAGQTVRT